MERDVAVLPPAGMSWGQYVAGWVADRGGWTQLADALMHRAGDGVAIARDVQTVERGLRRLARREHKSGGQYGRWMLRLFGFARPVESFVKWMGQYHTRFADLPSALRLEQLVLWNRPPVAESPLDCWIQVGIASVHRSRLDLAACEHWLALAERQAERAGLAATIEVGLLRGRLETDAGDRDGARRRYHAIEERLPRLDQADAIPYRARLQDQRAFHVTSGPAPDIAEARRLYQAIEEHPAVPFASFRRCSGLAYCAWQDGDLEGATRLAERAAEHAGDGGLVRMRVMALNMLSRVVGGDSAVAVNRRARQMASSLEDDDLLLRVDRCTP